MKMKCFPAMLALMAASAAAQPPPPGPRPPFVRAGGDAVVSVKPDQARIDIGVLTQASTAQAAASQNAAQLQAVLDKLRAALGTKAEIKSVSYSLAPNYQFLKDSLRTIKDYTATNVIEITTGDLTVIGQVIDTATEAGSNEIQRLQFLLKDESNARAEALRKATREARANAEAMAGAMGLKLGRMISLDQGTPQVIPRTMSMAANVAAATPIEAQAIEVHASVTLTMAVE